MLRTMAPLLTRAKRNVVAQKEYRLASATSKYLSLPHGTDINFNRTSFFSLGILINFPSSTLGSFQTIFSKRPASGAGWQLYKSNLDQLYFTIQGSGTQSAVVHGTALITPDQWHYVEMVYSGAANAIVFYIDGKEDTTVITSNNFTTDSMTNTNAVLVGTRLNSPIFSDFQVARIHIHNKALSVNEVPERLWNYGFPRSGSTVSNCVRNYMVQADTFSTNFTLIETVSGANGTSVNMTGPELVKINSVATPTPLNPLATPYNNVYNSVAWDHCGIGASYDIEASDDGSTGWAKVGNTTALLFKHYVGTGSTLKYYRIKATGNGTASGYSTVVSAATLPTAYSTTNYINTLRQGDNSYDFGLSVETQRTTNGFYDSISNKTYFVFMSRVEVGYSSAAWIYYRDEVTGLYSDIKYVGTMTRSGGDRHQLPAVIVNSAGYILVFFTNFHNGPMQVLKSFSAGTIDLGFNWVVEFGVRCDYPQLKKMSNGDLYCFFRSYDSGFSVAGTGYCKSTDGGTTWSAIQYIMQCTYSLGRSYPTTPIQPTSGGGGDRVYLNLDIRNDTGGPFPADPDKVGYFKDMGAMYSDDMITWRNIQNTFSKNVVSSGFITLTEWQTNFQYFDSAGTFEPGLATSVVTPSGKFYATHFRDATHANISYHNGTAWVNQNLTFPDSDPDIYTFAYNPIQAIVHVTGTTFDIYCCKTGNVKKYRTTDDFVTLTLTDANVLPNVSSKVYEHGTVIQNHYDAPTKLLYYSIKISSPTPTPTSPGAWSDIVIKTI